jgi:hypothetical protein
MNHSEANESAAAAAYVMGDLSGPERDAFEMHYIDCPVCAEEVWAGTRMLAAGQEAVKSPERKVIPFPMPWITVRAVAAALAVVVGIQGFVIWQNRLAPALPSIEVPASGPYLSGASRAADEPDKVIRFEGDQPIQFHVDIPPEPPFPMYRLEVRGASGKVLSDEVSEERTRSGDSIPLLVRPLPAGRYVLAIVGVRKDGNRSDLDQWSFVVQ